MDRETLWSVIFSARCDRVEKVANCVSSKSGDEHSRGQAGGPTRMQVTENQPRQEMRLSSAGRTENQPGACFGQTHPGVHLSCPERVLAVCCEGRDGEPRQPLAP